MLHLETYCTDTGLVRPILPSDMDLKRSDELDATRRPRALVPRGHACQLLSNVLGRISTVDDETSFGGAAFELPVLPGLNVKDVGELSLPVRQELVELLMEHCTKEGAGVWSLPPHRVQPTNVEWHRGLELLTRMSADRLGFKGVTLRTVLNKLVVIGEGGRLTRQQEDPSAVATLVVQLPSQFEGGDVVLSELGTQKRPLQKLKGVAAYKPLYVVHAADTIQVVEQVTSGYLVMAVYSLCLPSDRVGKKPVDVLQGQLVEAIQMLKARDDTAGSSESNAIEIDDDDDEEDSKFALMLTETCKAEDIETKGLEALTGVDRVRFELLQGANDSLPLDKQLTFYFASFRGGYNAWGTNKNTSWYLLNGAKLGNDISLDWQRRLNLLNPDKRTPSELLDGYFSSEHMAIVGWPASDDVINTYELMGKVGAIVSVLATSTIDGTKLRRLLEHIASLDLEMTLHESLYGYDSAVADNKRNVMNDSPVSLASSERLFKAIAELNNPSLFSIFMEKFFPQLETKESIIPLVAAFVRKTGWTAVGLSVKSALNKVVDDTRMGLALKLVEALQDNPEAQSSLTFFAVEKAQRLATNNSDQLAASADLGLLWKHIIMSQNVKLFQDVVSIFRRMDGMLLGPAVETLSKHVYSSSPLELRVGLAHLALTRRIALKKELAAMEKPFTWEIRVTDFPDAAAIANFLRGPKAVLEIQGFGGAAAARARAEVLRNRIEAPLEITTILSGESPRVQIQKIGGEFSTQNAKARGYKAEVARLGHILQADGINGGSNSIGPNHKRPREDDLAGPAA